MFLDCYELLQKPMSNAEPTNTTKPNIVYIQAKGTLAPEFGPFPCSSFPDVFLIFHSKNSSPKFVPRVPLQGVYARAHPSAHSGVQVLSLGQRVSYLYLLKSVFCPPLASVLPLTSLTRSMAAFNKTQNSQGLRHPRYSMAC